MCIQKKSSSVKITLLLKVDLEGFEPLTSRMRTERSPMRTLKKPPKDKTFLLENGKKYRRNAVFWTSIAFEKKLPFLLQSELFIIALFRKMMLQRMGNRPRSDAQHSQLILYFLFPCASFVMLVILLYVTSGHNIEEFVSAGCCILIFISNVAVLFLLERIPTTKPEPQMHGFGLANIRLILEKYSGEYTMFYENGWFQFTADIPFTPIS